MKRIELYPLPLTWRQVKLVWGGSDWSPLLGRAGTELVGVGELWLNDDRAGGSAVASGPLQGMELGKLVSQAPMEILGPAWAGLGRFPILLKFLNTDQWLSVQVHPDEDETKCKHEAWHIVGAGPKTEIISGVKDGLGRAAVARAATEGRWPEILNFRRVAVGEVYYAPAGLIHAIGPGTLIFEIQQNNDITYRLYDWDRNGPDGRPRETHVEEALAAARPELQASRPLEPAAAPCQGGERIYLAACRHFLLSRLELSQPHQAETRDLFRLLTGLKGRGQVVGNGQEVEIEPGRTVLLPASLGGYEIRPKGEMTVLESSAPESIDGLVRELVQPLKEAGVADERILGLAGGEGEAELAPALQRWRNK